MKKIFLTIFIFVFVANVSAQLKVNSSGETHVAKSILLGSSTSFLGTTSSSTPFPLTFKVNNVLAGSTGTLLNSNVSFGYQALNSSMGSGNVAVGSRALYFNTSTSNTANGFEALYSNLNGASNTANVAYALDELQKSDDPKINAFNDSLRNARSPEEKAIDAKARAKKEEIVYSGFIAQDVEAAAQSLSYDFSGVDAPDIYRLLRPFLLFFYQPFSDRRFGGVGGAKNSPKKPPKKSKKPKKKNRKEKSQKTKNKPRKQQQK